MGKQSIYIAHLMERKEIPVESILRPNKLKYLIGEEEYNYNIPENWEYKLKKEDIYNTDRMYWERSDIVIADMYDLGLKREAGKSLLGRGTLMEIGWTLMWNYLTKWTRKKKKILVIIDRYSVNQHPFFSSSDINIVCTSLEEAALYIKEKKWLKK